MTARPRVVIATASYGGGHHAIADAVAEVLRSRHPPVGSTTVDLLERCAPRAASLARIAYGAGEDFFPDGAGDLTDMVRSQGHDPLLADLAAGGISSAATTLSALDPAAVIAVHPVAGAIAAEVRQRVGCVVASIVPSLGEESRLWAHPAVGLWFVATNEVRDRLVRRGVEWSSAVVSGVPIRAGEGVGNGCASGDRFTASVMDTGRADARSVVAELAGKGVRVVTTVPADDGRGRKGADVAEVMDPKTPVERTIAVSDVVVTGPCGEAQWLAPALGKPLIVVCPVPALESASVRVLAYAGAALVARDAEEAAGQAAYLMRHPERVSSMASDASRIGRPAAARAVVERLLAHLA